LHFLQNRNNLNLNLLVGFYENNTNYDTVEIFRSTQRYYLDCKSSKP